MAFNILNSEEKHMRIENLGAINTVNLTLNKLLIFTGNNNSGKTYTSYLLYGLLSTLSEKNFFKVTKFEKIKEFLENRQEKIFKIEKVKVENEYVKQAIECLNHNLMDIVIKNFKISEKYFEKFELEVTEEDIRNILGDFCIKESISLLFEGLEFEVKVEDETYIVSKTDNYNEDILGRFLSDDINIEFLIMQLSNILIKIPNVVYFPAERNGINVFRNELNEKRLKTYDTIMTTLQYTNLKSQKDKEKMRKELLRQNFDLIFETESNSVYPKPISDYINFLNSIKQYYSMNSGNPISRYIRDNILNGKYEIDSKSNTVLFRQRMGKTRYKSAIPFHVASSSVKSLYGLDYYVDNTGKLGDFLIIDEPELSLHPKNQVELAVVISMIIDSGIKVILSTHSDLFLRSLINIVLDNKVNNKNNSISEKDIYVYYFKGKKVESYNNLLKISDFENFDKDISKIQKKYNDLMESLYEFEEIDEETIND